MSLIDEDAYGRLADVIGADGLKLLTEECVKDLSGAVERMAVALAAGDGAVVKRVAHLMAGVLAQYACLEPAKAARALSQGSEPDALMGAPLILTQCRAAIDDLRTRANHS